MNGIYEDFMGELKKIFPEDFETWEVHASLHWLTHLHTDAIVAVGLARLTNTPSILPIALYLCCQLEGAYLLGGRQRVDGKIDLLSSEDFVRCFDAKAKLCSRAFQLMPLVFGPLSNTKCMAPTNDCEIRLESLLRGAIEAAALDDADILSTRCRHYKASDKPLCNSCTAIFVQREKDIRKMVWAELPSMLRLDAC